MVTGGRGSVRRNDKESEGGVSETGATREVDLAKRGPRSTGASKPRDGVQWERSSKGSIVGAGHGVGDRTISIEYRPTVEEPLGISVTPSVLYE